MLVSTWNWAGKHLVFQESHLATSFRQPRSKSYLLFSRKNWPELVDPTGQGKLQVIPIVGGTFTGAKINGIVVPGGADWNTTRDDGIAHVFAKYLLETSDSEFIAIENEGLIDPNLETVIKTKPTFMANNTGKYRDLDHGIYVGELSGTPNVKDSVDIVIYKLW